MAAMARTVQRRDGLRLARGIGWALTLAIPWWAVVLVGMWLLLAGCDRRTLDSGGGSACGPLGCGMRVP